MRTTLCRFVGVLLILGGLFITTASAQDFQKSYTIRTGGRINIHTRSGPVTIAGYDGEAVIVKGFKNGRDRDVVKIEDLSSQTASMYAIVILKNASATRVSGSRCRCLARSFSDLTKSSR